jgi:serine/threonine protein kinase
LSLRRLQEVNRQWSESPFIADNVGALSPEARDLLDKIFVVDPTKRITIPEIMQHPW